MSEKEAENVVALSDHRVSLPVITSLDEIQRYAKMFAASKLIPKDLQGQFTDVCIILQAGADLGIPPTQAISGINVIQGKPSVSPELQLALIRSRCPESFITIGVDEKTQTVKCTMAPSKERMEEAFTTVWDMKRANDMGLAGKDNYKKQPLTMLKWRAVGEAARTVFPHVTKGFYNSVEAEDLIEMKKDRGGVYSAKAKDLNEKFGIKKDSIPEPEPIVITAENTSGLEIEH